MEVELDLGQAGHELAHAGRQAHRPMVAEAAMPPGAGRLPPMAIPTLGRVLRRIAWVLVAGVIALGGAGLAAGATLPPTDATRPELTSRGDAAMVSGLTDPERRPHHAR